MNFQGNIRTWAANQIASYVQDVGSVDAYEVTPRPPITAYTEGLLIRFIAASTNTGQCTLSTTNLGPFPLKKNVTDDLAAGDILAGQIVEAVFDGTNFQVIGGSSFSLETLDTNTIHLFGTGTILDPLYAEAQISGFPNNALLEFADGLYVPNLIQSGVVYGGIVTWLGDYDFHVSAAGYYINFVFYESPEAFITLSPSDLTLDRIDTFIVDNTGTASVLEGTPAASPAQAPLDPATQLELSIVLVQAASTDPGVTTECIYLENTEWTSSTSNVFTLNPNSTNNPCTGLKSIEGTAVVNNDNVLLTYGGAPFNPTTSYTILTFKIKSKGAWGNPNRRLNIQWELAGTPVGAAIQLWNGSPYGFDSSNTTDCQIISVPLTAFGLIPSATIDSLRIRVTLPNGSIGFYIDDMCLQGTITPPPPPSGGTSGTSGTSGSGTSGTSGVAGTSGTSPATAGTAGTSGTSGTSAATSGTSGSGTSGTSGTSGVNGANGTSGLNGNSGSSGTSGSNGTSGVNGTSGTSGQNGLAGTSGSSGTTAIGAPGTSGSSGTSAANNGTSGSSGSSGTSAATSGTSGSGTSGTSGQDGTSGLNGTSGVNGTSGTSGNGTSGSSGTSASGGGVYTVNNGLTENVANNFQWGGTLVQNTTINAVGFTSFFTGTSNVLSVSKTGGANANAIQASGSASSPTIQSTHNSGAGQAILGWNNGTGIGVDGWSLSTFSIQGRRTGSTNNDILPIANLLRLSSAGSANGIGGYLNYQIQNSTGFGVDAGRVAVKWTDNTATAEDSQMEFWLKSAGSIAKKSSISDIGQWTWDTYGSGTHTGAPTRYLGVTSTGVVIEVDVPTGGATTADNGLTMSTATNVQLGGTLLQNTTIDATALYQLIVTGSVPSTTADGVVTVYNTNAAGSSSTAIRGEASANAAGRGVLGVAAAGYGVRGQATTGYGVFGTVSGTGFGIGGWSDNGVGGFFRINPTSTNTTATVMQVMRTSTGTAANNIAGSIDFMVKTDAANHPVTNQLISKLTTAADATRTSQFIITGVNSAVTGDIAYFNGNGMVGIGAATASATRLYVEDNSVGAASIVNISSTSTAAAGNVQKGIAATLSGANATASQTTYTIHSRNLHTGTGSQNYAIYGEASGGASLNVGVYGTGTSRGVQGATTTAFGVGVYGTSSVSGTAGWFIGSSGATGVQANSIDAVAIAGIRIPASTNTVVPVFQLQRETTGTAAAGIGGSIDLYLEDTLGTSPSNQIIWTYTDAVQATRTSSLIFNCTNSGTLQTKMELRGNDDIVFNQGLQDFADDTAAGAGGIPVNGLYRNGSVVMIRVS